ncbi:MAG: UMP kinase [Alphaproteobacteria bacterium]|nr:UMP kinase [Alphaproteobacteria bacterium]
MKISQLKYKRVLLKISGESLSGDKTKGEVFDPAILLQYAHEVKSIVDLGIEVGLVIGGGNIYRGADANEMGIEQAHGDYMGMMATVINCMAMQAVLEKIGLSTRLLSAIKIDQISEFYIRRRAIRHLEKGRIVIFGSGTGNPYFTTDTAGVLRAIEIKADIILKGTRVDGIYDADPEKNPDAVKYDHLKYDECILKKLKIMDQTAFTMCSENKLPIIVFNINQVGNLVKIIQGDLVGTKVN